MWLMLAPLILAAAPASPQSEIPLFNGRDFTGWTFFLEHKEYNSAGKGRISDFATIRPGGVIEIDPRMHGALMTKRDYLNYRLHAEFRWPMPTSRDDSGLFLRIRPPFVWDMEHGEIAGIYQLQIQPGNTGDLWVIGFSESMLKTDPGRSYKPFGTLELGPQGSFRRHLKSRDAELPAGQWNSIDTEVLGKTIKVFVNGQLVNEGTNLVDLPGRIGLESERGVVQFRNLRLQPL
jgi:hypothetical protein